MNPVTHIWSTYFSWPDGGIWGNVWAEPVIAVLTVTVVWPFRNKLYKRFIKFHHKHHTAHLASLRESHDDQTADGS